MKTCLDKAVEARKNSVAKQGTRSGTQSWPEDDNRTKQQEEEKEQEEEEKEFVVFGRILQKEMIVWQVQNDFVASAGPGARSAAFEAFP